MNSRRSSRGLSESDADALLSGRAVPEHDDLREVVGLMRTAATVPAPAPSAALAAVLSNGFAPLPVGSARRGSRWGRWAVRIGVATAAAMTMTVGAGAANALPGPLQAAVADIVGAVTPLQLPRPAPRPDQGSTDSGGASDEPSGGRGRDSGADAETGGDAGTGTSDSSTQPVDATPTAPGASPRAPQRPAVVVPPRRPGTASTAPESDEPDTDEPDTDEPDTDEPDTDEPDTDEPDDAPDDAPDADADQPDLRVDDGDDDHDLSEADGPELDVDAGPEQDDSDSDD